MKNTITGLYGAAEDLRRSVVRRGILRTARIGLERVRSLSPGDVISRMNRPAGIKDLPHPFDSEYGVDTGGLIASRDLDAGHPHDAHSVGYYGVAPSVFRGLLRNWLETLRTSDCEIESYTFVDLGAGKGRALLLASEVPFREVIGVELNANLAQIAERKVERWQQAGRARSEIRVICQDVTEFAWPQTPLVVYLYNPFGHKVMARLLARLQSAIAAGAGPVDILYANPDCAFVMDRHPEFARLWSQHIEVSEADRMADFYALSSELVSAYRCVRV